MGNIQIIQTIQNIYKPLFIRLSMNQKEVLVSIDTHRKLILLKAHLGLKNMDEAVKEALKTCKVVEKFMNQSEKLNIQKRRED